MRTIRIFLGGGVKLLHGENEFLKGYRNDVIDPVVSQLNSQEFTKHIFVTKDYSDLTRNVVSGKHQDVYNNYIAQDAHVALFIIDGNIGKITKEEIDIAVSSAKKTHHPIVYIYGINISDNDKILEYLSQEGIYFQHYYDNRDLAAKIKADLTASAKQLDRQRNLRLWMSVLLSCLVCGSVFLFARNCSNDNNMVESCSLQLYLMRYKDVNVLVSHDYFTDSLLATFQYEDSLMSNDDVDVFPIIKSDSVFTTSPPFFRLKIHNKHRNTIVLVSAERENEKYSVDNGYTTRKNVSQEINDGNLHHIIVSKDDSYSLEGFRQSIAYGEIDDRYFYYITSSTNCSFRMRVKAKSQLGDILYSNYVYVRYVK